MRYKLLILLIIALISLFLVYIKSIGAPYVYDDIPMVEKNLFVAGRPSLPALLSSNYLDSNRLLEGYRPLTLLSLNMVARSLGNSPAAQRSINLLIHFINSILIFLLLIRIFEMTGSSSRRFTLYAAFFGAALFCFHPLASGSINLVWKRSTLLFSAFYLSSMLLYLRGSSRYLIFLLFTLGLLCKESMITLPLSLLILGFVFRSSAPVKKPFKNELVFFLTMFALAGLYFVFRIYILGGLDEAAHQIKLPGRFHYLEHQFIALIRYMNLFFIPNSLNIDHYIELGVLSVEKWVSLILILVFLALALYKLLFTDIKIVGFSIIFFFLALLPSSSIFPLVIYMDEARAYLPMFGLITVISFFLFAMLNLRQGQKLKLYLIIPCVIIASFASLTFSRNLTWQDPLKLWQDSVSKNPRNPRALDALGSALSEKGFHTQAMDKFRKAISLDPEFYPPYEDMGLNYIKMKDYEKGERFLKMGEKILPNNPLSLHNLAFLYGHQEYFKPKLAIRYHKKLLKRWGDNLNSRYRLGLIYLKLEEPEAAKINLNNALYLLNKMPPLDEKTYSAMLFNIHYSLGNIYRSQRDSAKAANHYERALGAKPKDINAMINLAGIYLIKGQTEKSIDLYNDVLKREPTNMKAISNLALAYERKGDHKMAAQIYKRLKDMEKYIGDGGQ